MTAVLHAPATAAPAQPGPRRRWLPALLLVALVGLALGVGGVRAALSRVGFDALAVSFAGEAPVRTLPSYGLRGTHVVGYEHGATTRLTLPVRNQGVLPVTVASLDLRAGVAPLLSVRDVQGLPLDLGPGERGELVVTAVLGNCRYFHEREVQIYQGVALGVNVLGRSIAREVAFDRPLLVHSPMLVGCPDRKLNRQADNRSDLLRAG